MSVVTTAAPAAARYRLERGGGITPPAVGAYGMPGPYVYDVPSAWMIPAVSRAVQLYGGLVKQLPIDAYRGYTRIAPTPRICQRPDPLNAASWFVQVSVEDYLLYGNAVSYITQRGADGWPLTVEYLPAPTVYVNWLTPGRGEVATYYYYGTPLATEDVIHVKRGVDRFYPVRGVGIVEQHLSTLDRVAMEEEYERGALAGGAVPSVAVITPQATLTQDVADDAKAAWQGKFAGPQREPVILPNGTVVQPLAWSPTDTQLSEARRLSLIDVANIFNLDGFWLQAPVAGMTYKSTAAQYQTMLRTSLEPLLADFEDVWSYAWLPRGTNVRFRRSQLLREDLAVSTQAAVAAYGAGIMTQQEARVEIGLPPNVAGAIGGGADLIQPAPEVDPAGAPDGGPAADSEVEPA